MNPLERISADQLIDKPNRVCIFTPIFELAITTDDRVTIGGDSDNQMSANPLTFQVNPIPHQQLNERDGKLGINRSKLIVTAIREYLDKQAKTPAV